DTRQTQLELLSNAMDHAIADNNVMWTTMLPYLGPEVTQRLKAKAETRFLELLPSLKSTCGDDTLQEEKVALAQNLLAIIDAIIKGGAMSKPAQLQSCMVDRLVDVCEVITSGTEDMVSMTIRHWLPVLLSFLTLHSGSFDSSKVSNEIRARALLSLSGII